MNKTRKDLKSGWVLPKVIFNFILVFIMLLYMQYAYLSLSPTVYGQNIDEFSSNRNTLKTILNADRGVIFDSQNETLALNVSSYTVIAYLSPNRTGSSPTPKHVVDKELTAEKLAPVINMEKERILTLLNTDAYQVELGPGGRNITELKKEEISLLNLPGISFVENRKRYYPNGDFASYLIGYAKQHEKLVTSETGSKIEYSIVGELGIEGKYNDLLKGTDGYLEYQKDRFGYKIPDTKEIRVDPINGHNIHVTIDSNIQRFVESAVKAQSSVYNPEWMNLTVMEAKTGKILASTSTPSYDPNLLNITNYENQLTTYLFEPGSVMKTYTYMCAIEKGTYRGSDTFMSGSIEVGIDKVSDWNRVGWGTITYNQGFEFSSNVGVVNLLQKYLTKADLKECLDSYGFGEKTGIELPRELSGAIRFNYPIEVAAAGFGQGITTTPIQQLQAASIIANNGKMVKPTIIDRIVNPNTGEIVYQSEKVESESIVSEKTITEIRQLMENVIAGNDVGTTGRRYFIEGFDVIGKTATAQVFDTKAGKYTNKTISSFIGMYPKDNPEIIIYSAALQPQFGGSRVISNSVTEIMKNIAKYRNMFKDANAIDNVTEFTVGNYINKTKEEALELLSSNNVIVLGEGNKIIKQSIAPNTKILSNDKLVLLTNDNEHKMPNLKGYSRADATIILDMLNIKYEINGYGYVTSQNILPNSIITNDEIIILELNGKYDLEL
jgi:penicillin-binding protein 2B